MAAVGTIMEKAPARRAGQGLFVYEPDGAGLSGRGGGSLLLFKQGQPLAPLPSLGYLNGKHPCAFAWAVDTLACGYAHYQRTKSLFMR